MTETVIPLPQVPCLPIAGKATVFPVGRIFCVGRNYASHAREMGVDPDREAPFFFMKPASSLVPQPESLPYPSMTRELHHEVELVVALRHGGRDLDEAAAREAIYGYAVGLDLTRRDLQAAAKERRHPWEAGKAFDASAPCAALTPCEGTLWPAESRISLTVNGEEKQSATLDHMIWSTTEILCHLSRLFTLQAGDLIMTGTPAGVGALERGDRIIAQIEGLQPLEFTI